MTTAAQRIIEVRAIAPRERHPLIFSTFEDLEVGHSLELVNDHDPKPLCYQFEAERAGTFGWRYLESGPEVWRVRITKRVIRGRAFGLSTKEFLHATDELH
ncbi:MAG TPA: DUF2249 domain-containing protein [Burkholderiaceae bacterium]|nr:DUF2249 domain-containing protein [Burkholderiaceae bacterium]